MSSCSGEPWADNALCRGLSDVFFSAHPADVAAAKRLCAECPVSGPCEVAGRGQAHGVWSGEVKHYIYARPLLSHLAAAEAAFSDGLSAGTTDPTDW